jgi:ankyrin repeat protein
LGATFVKNEDAVEAQEETTVTPYCYTVSAEIPRGMSAVVGGCKLEISKYRMFWYVIFDRWMLTTSRFNKKLGVSSPIAVKSTKAKLETAKNLNSADTYMHRSRKESHVSAVPTLDKNMQLLEAAGKGELSLVQSLVEAGALVDARDKRFNKTSLHWSASFGHLDVARFLIEAGALVDARGGRLQRTPLHLAAEKGHLDIARLLVQSGASIDARDDYQVTPLHLTAEQGHLDIARLIVQSGASIDARDDYQNTPLHYAASFGFLDIIQMLLDAGADRTIRDSNGYTAAQLAIKYEHFEAAELLKQDH